MWSERFLVTGLFDKKKYMLNVFTSTNKSFVEWHSCVYSSMLLILRLSLFKDFISQKKKKN